MTDFRNLEYPKKMENLTHKTKPLVTSGCVASGGSDPEGQTQTPGAQGGGGENCQGSGRREMQGAQYTHEKVRLSLFRIRW